MILTSQKIITMHRNAPPLDNGAVVVHKGAILAIGPVHRIIKKYPHHRVQHLKNCVLMPGLINLHTHLELPPLLDAVRAKTFPEWVLNLIYAKKGLDEKDYVSAARNNIETLIRTGTSTVAEICTHGMSPALLKQSGLRGAIFHEIISMNPSSFVPRLSSLIPLPSSLLKHGLSPHAPYTVSEELLQKIIRFSQQNNTRLSMHVAESKDETRLLRRKKSGLEKLYQFAGWDTAWAPSADSPFEYLKAIGMLDRNFLAVHSVQAAERDIRTIKRAKTPVAHCPRSNHETGVGRMPLKRFLDAGITVGLGTDSLASSPSLNMWDEMRYALSVHLKDGIIAQDIFKLATINGAEALGMEKETGTLESGKKADVIAVPLPQKDTGNLYSDLLRETKSCIMSMVNGKMLFGRR